MSTPTYQEYPDHQRLEHRDMFASIAREGCHTREDVNTVGGKVAEGFTYLSGKIDTGVQEVKYKVGESACGVKEFVGNAKTEIKDGADRYYISGEANADVRAKNLLDAILHSEDTSTNQYTNLTSNIDSSRERLQEILAAQNTVNVAAHRDTILELTKDICGVEKEVIKGFGQGSLEHCRDTGSLSKQMSEGFSAVQLEAAKNKFDLSKQLSDCCCEMKEKLIETASATQQLIRDQENNRLRDSLAAAANENLYLRLSGQNSGCHGGRP